MTPLARKDNNSAKRPDERNEDPGRNVPLHRSFSATLGEPSVLSSMGRAMHANLDELKQLRDALRYAIVKLLH